jgi:CHASE2 domain-containing sensor protein
MPTLLGARYQVIAVLGVGGFGQTYLAEDIQHPQRVQCVIKQFKPTSQDSRFLETARRLFDTEVATLRRLGQHRQIPDFLDFFEDAGEFYLVQEYIDGAALSYEFATCGKLNETQAIAILQDILTVLEFVHSNQVIHRDIKPSNLIRRRSDNQIVLIDFGAVKEIQTQLNAQLQEASGQTNFTVGIGTRGYSPSEQLAGQPRFCSDIYGLGVTMIQAVTGLHPTQLPVNADTGELIWREYANLSPGFAAILEQMVRYHFSQRFQSTRDVALALQQLPSETIDLTQIPARRGFPFLFLANSTGSQADTSKQETFLWSQADTRLDGTQNHRLQKRRSWRLAKSARRIVLVSLAITSLVAGVRQLGWLDAPELAVYDRLMRWRPHPGVDPRLLIVEISEQDLQSLQRPTPSDRDVAQVIETLAQHQPSVIGLDLLRELPQEPGHAELLQQLQTAKVVTIFKLGNAGIEIPAPPGVPIDRIGFSDVVVDGDGVIRRNLMFATTEAGSFSSFAVQLSLKYLGSREITPRNSAAYPDLMQLGETVFFPLEPHSGGYHQADAGGYQILLDYQAPISPAPVVSFTDVLNDRLDPSLVENKIVLIGTTAASGKDVFTTPYSAGRADDRMPGVMLHAQMVSQLLRTVLDARPLFRFVPDWAELLWIAAWATVGGSIAIPLRHPLTVSIATAIVVVVCVSTSFVLFINYVWLPVFAPGMAIVIASVAIVSLRSNP